MKNMYFYPWKNEDIKHIIFDSSSSQRLWKKLNSILNIDLFLKRIILGFYLEKFQKLHNTFMSYCYL